MPLSHYKNGWIRMSYRDDFLNEEYDKCIDEFKKEIKEDKEEYDSAYYMLASILASNDIYLGLSIIKKSKLLNQESITAYLDKEGANLVNLLVENDEVKKVVVLLMFINSHKDCDMNDTESYLSFFEMIDSLYEIGYSSEIIKELTNVGHIIFKM